MIQNQKRERRDWTLLIFIIPLGVLLIIIVGQFAIRLSPNWSVNADMNSNLKPDPNAAPPLALLQPILPQILTPMAWMESYLTPGADIYFPPFMTFEPTATPPPTKTIPTQVSDTPVPTASETPSPTSTSATGIPPSTGTPKETEPPGGGGGSSTSPPTTPPPTTPPPTTPPPTTPPPTTPPPTTPAPTGYPDTIDPLYGTPAPVPTELGVGATPDNTDPYTDNNIGFIQDGSYIVISLQVTVGATPDNNYDLAFYEWNNAGFVYLDWIIIGITNDNTGSQYYEVFNWGEDQSPDTNSNVSAYSAGGEGDDEQIPLAGLHDPDGAGTAPSSGVLIDVDNASSEPPPDTYNFVVIISPPDSGLPPPDGGGGAAQVDAIEATEVPIIPTP